MKCKVNLVLEEGTSHIVKRRFIPMVFNVEYKGQFLNAATKLPFTSNKVIGLLSATKQISCDDTPQTPRYYFGITDEQMVNSSFLAETNGIEYTSVYPPDLELEPLGNKFWYYAHPVGDLLPSVLYNNVFQDLGTPISITVKKDGQCEGVPYYLWSNQFLKDATIVIGFYLPA